MLRKEITMEHKILSQDCFEAAFDSVRGCIHDTFCGDDRQGDSCPINKCDFSCVDNFPLAMAYIPMQKFENIYSLDEALCAGTLFKDLDKPFLGDRNGRKGWQK